MLKCDVVGIDSWLQSIGVLGKFELPCVLAFGSIAEVFFSLCIFSTALSTFGVDNVEVSVGEKSGLSGDVTTQSRLSHEA